MRCNILVCDQLNGEVKKSNLIDTEQYSCHANIVPGLLKLSCTIVSIHPILSIPILFHLSSSPTVSYLGSSRTIVCHSIMQLLENRKAWWMANPLFMLTTPFSYLRVSAGWDIYERAECGLLPVKAWWMAQESLFKK